MMHRMRRLAFRARSFLTQLRRGRPVTEQEAREWLSERMRRVAEKRGWRDHGKQ